MGMFDSFYNDYTPNMRNFVAGADYLTPEQRQASATSGWLNTAANLFAASEPRTGAPVGFGGLAAAGLQGFGQGANGYVNNLTSQSDALQKMKYTSDLAQWYSDNPQVGEQMGLPQGMPVTPALLSDFYKTKAETAAKHDPLDDALKQAHINYFDSAAKNKTNGVTPPKPMPAAAVKLQQENLEAIGTAKSINADLGAFEKAIDDKKLDLGLWSNLKNQGKNYVGMGDDQSSEYASFQSTLEKQRNESLRLNKGVQTEGDAERAWNELFKNMNDEKVVKRRLQEIQRINERAALLHKNDNDILRSNYNQPDMDYSPYEKVKSAINPGQTKGGDNKILAAHPDAKQAPDGNYYVQKNGKYFRVVE